MGCLLFLFECLDVEFKFGILTFFWVWYEFSANRREKFYSFIFLIRNINKMKYKNILIVFYIIKLYNKFLVLST